MRWACVALAAVLAVGRAAGAPPDDYGPVADFALTDQDGRTVTRADLLGKVWVASFIFTRCASACPQVTHTMAELQRHLAGRPGFVLVSVTVDPEHDTPAVLKRYAASHEATPGRWLFLTGKQDDVYRLIRDSFKLAVEQNEGPARTPGNEVTHSSRLALVDRQGHVRGYFDGRQTDEAHQPVNDLPRLEEQVAELLHQGRWLRPADLPAVNACLNAAAAVLLLAGYAAIRRRRVRLHQACMLAALAVSAVFLASYLYYHFAVRGGRPTRFTAEGWVRGLYFAVLGSHTLLAVVVAPLALATAYLGLRGRLAGHVRLARWTLPLWLYVSITGVVVYCMLYQLFPPAAGGLE